MVISDYLKRIRIFIASPRDLNVERKIFRDAVERVNTIKAKSQGILLEAVGMEDTLPGKSRPQEKINEDIKKSNLIVMLLWKRWGSPTGKYSSGFEEEYEVACTHEKDIWLYFRDISDDILEDPGDQVKNVLEFREKVETEKKFYFRKYKDQDAWKEQFIDDLCRWLDEADTLEAENQGTPQQKGEVVKSKPTLVSSGGGGGRGKAALENLILPTTTKPRVYDEKQQPPIGSAQLPSYKWDALNFEGFWYDLKTGITSETLEIGGQHAKPLIATIDHNRRTIPENTLAYRTVKRTKTLKVIESGINPVDLVHAFGASGQYNVVGWQAQPYVAVKGKANKLSKLIIEQGTALSDSINLPVGKTWDFGDGWTLLAKEIDARASPIQVWLVLSKDGIKLDDKVIARGGIYVYTEKNLAGESDVPLFVTYVDNIFVGATSKIVQLRYTWAISKSVTEIKTGDKFGKMEVITASSENLILRNKDEPINLIDTTVDVMGNLKFKVADDPNFLRFYPVVLSEQ